MDTSDIGTSTSGRGRGRRGAASQAQPEAAGIVALGPRDTLIGTLTVDGDVRIEGTVQGEVTATGEVSIQPGGVARAQIEARDIIIAGELDGTATARDLAIVGDAATFTGELTSSRLRVDEGANVNATIRMSVSGDAPPARRMEEHDEAAVDVTGSAVVSESGDEAYADVSAGSEPDAYSGEPTPEISAVGSESSEG